MSRAYYYLVASLPSLNWGTRPPMAYDDFLLDCHEQLSRSDFEIMSQITLDLDDKPKKGNPILKSWGSLNRNLKNEIAKFRARRVGKNPADYIRGEEINEDVFSHVIEEASKAQDPLTAEKILDRFRWQHLDEISWNQYFNLEFLIVYALKLKILERYKQIEISPKRKEIYQGYKALIENEDAVKI